MTTSFGRSPRPLFAQSPFDPCGVFWTKRFKVGLLFSNATHCTNPDVDRLLESAGRVLCTAAAPSCCADGRQALGRNNPAGDSLKLVRRFDMKSIELDPPASQCRSDAAPDVFQALRLRLAQRNRQTRFLDVRWSVGGSTGAGPISRCNVVNSVERCAGFEKWPSKPASSALFLSDCWP